MDITKLILSTLDKPESLKTFVTDRKGHDRRYALNIDKIRALGWQPRYQFETAIQETIQWYQNNRSWWEKLKSGEYKEYYQKQYANH